MDLIAKQNDMNTTNESNTSSRERIYITIYVTNFLSWSAYSVFTCSLENASSYLSDIYMYYLVHCRNLVVHYILCCKTRACTNLCCTGSRQSSTFGRRILVSRRVWATCMGACLSWMAFLSSSMFFSISKISWRTCKQDGRKKRYMKYFALKNMQVRKEMKHFDVRVIKYVTPHSCILIFFFI